MSLCGLEKHVGAVAAGLVGLITLAACRHGEPPAADVDASVAPLPPPNAGAGAGTGAGAATGADAGAGAGSSPPATANASAAALSDAGPDPSALPQTKDKPSASGADFDARVLALWNGIVEDDVERAMLFFFPLRAYEQVKAVGNPGADWRRRLVGAYKRDLHALHERLGEGAKDAKLVRIDVPDDRARWVEPGDEYNKLGYWRVYGTRLVYERNGKERTFEVTSLISWRGTWYVVHLSGFK
jgi:hypothetical protein